MPKEYAKAGVDYEKIEPFKQIMVEMGKQTLTFPNRRGVFINHIEGHWMLNNLYDPLVKFKAGSASELISLTILLILLYTKNN